jgi:hypothetical protein
MEPTASDAISMLQELRGADDHTIINQYFDTIDKLVALVMEGHGAQAKDEGLCDTVLHLQDVSCAGCAQQGCSLAVHSLRLLFVLAHQHPGNLLAVASRSVCAGILT